MHKFIALISLLLSFAGCDPFGQSFTTRAVDNGRTLLESKVTVREQLASFHCITSSSGECHYALFKRDCPADAACQDPPFHQFEMPSGSKHDITGLQAGFVLCVSGESTPMTSSCLHPRSGRNALAIAAN